MSYLSYKSYIITATILLLTLPTAVLALEVDFPSVQGVKVTDSMGPAQWIRYIFLMSQALVGLAIIYALVRSGVEWMTARGNEGQVKVAKERITGAVLGLIILLGSYIFLYTINPQLVQIRNPSVNFPVTSDYDFYRKLFGQIGHGDGNIGNQCSGNYDCKAGLKCQNRACVAVADTEKSACTTDNPCAGDEERCLNPTTGEYLTPGVPGQQGVCTLRRPTGGACAPTGASDTGCFVGTCQNNTCVLTPSTE
ncbi:MAG: pilin [Minisyncoccia bacterium]